MCEIKSLYRYGIEYFQHPALCKHIMLLDRLVTDRVFGVFYTEEDGFNIQECCDDWYSHELTKEECLELSEMFKEIALYID